MKPKGKVIKMFSNTQSINPNNRLKYNNFNSTDLNAMAENIIQLKDENKKISIRSDKLSTNFEDITAYNKILGRDLSTLDQEITELEEKLSRSNKKINNIERETNELTEKANYYKSELLKDPTYAKIFKKLRNLQKTKSIANAFLDKRNSFIENPKLDKLDDAVQSIEDKIYYLQFDNTELDKQIGLLKKVLANEISMDDIQDEIDSLNNLSDLKCEWLEMRLAQCNKSSSLNKLPSWTKKFEEGLNQSSSVVKKDSDLARKLTSSKSENTDKKVTINEASANSSKARRLSLVSEGDLKDKNHFNSILKDRKPSNDELNSTEEVRGVHFDVNELHTDDNNEEKTCPKPVSHDTTQNQDLKRILPKPNIKATGNSDDEYNDDSDAHEAVGNTKPERSLVFVEHVIIGNDQYAKENSGGFNKHGSSQYDESANPNPLNKKDGMKSYDPSSHNEMENVGVHESIIDKKSDYTDNSNLPASKDDTKDRNNSIPSCNGTGQTSRDGEPDPKSSVRSSKNKNGTSKDGGLGHKNNNEDRTSKDGESDPKKLDSNNDSKCINSKDEELDPENSSNCYVVNGESKEDVAPHSKGHNGLQNIKTVIPEDLSNTKDTNNDHNNKDMVPKDVVMDAQDDTHIRFNGSRNDDGVVADCDNSVELEEYGYYDYYIPYYEEEEEQTEELLIENPSILHSLSPTKGKTEIFSLNFSLSTDQIHPNEEAHVKVKYNSEGKKLIRKKRKKGTAPTEKKDVNKSACGKEGLKKRRIRKLEKILKEEKLREEKLRRSHSGKRRRHRHRTAQSTDIESKHPELSIVSAKSQRAFSHHSISRFDLSSEDNRSFENQSKNEIRNQNLSCDDICDNKLRQDAQGYSVNKEGRHLLRIKNILDEGVEYEYEFSDGNEEHEYEYDFQYNETTGRKKKYKLRIVYDTINRNKGYEYYDDVDDEAADTELIKQQEKYPDKRPMIVNTGISSIFEESGIPKPAPGSSTSLSRVKSRNLVSSGSSKNLSYLPSNEDIQSFRRKIERSESVVEDELDVSRKNPLSRFIPIMREISAHDYNEEELRRQIELKQGEVLEKTNKLQELNEELVKMKDPNKKYPLMSKFRSHSLNIHATRIQPLHSQPSQFNRVVVGVLTDVTGSDIVNSERAIIRQESEKKKAKKLESGVNEMNSRITTLEKKIADAQKEGERLQKRISELRAESKAIQTEINDTKANSSEEVLVKDRQKELESLTSQIQVKQSYLDRVLNEVQLYELHIKEMESYKRQLSRELDDITNRVKPEVRSLLDDVKNSKQQIQNLQNQFNEQTTLLKNKRKDLENLRASDSWKKLLELKLNKCNLDRRLKKWNYLNNENRETLQVLESFSVRNSERRKIVKDQLLDNERKLIKAQEEFHELEKYNLLLNELIDTYKVRNQTKQEH